MLMNLAEVLAKMGDDDKIEFIRFVCATVGIEKDESEAIEMAAKNAAKIYEKLEKKALIDKEVVEAYNKYIRKAFPDKFKNESEECSQEDKSDD